MRRLFAPVRAAGESAPLPVLVVAEVSANHNQSVERAETIIRAAAAAGADAVKLQTYTADTLTIPCDNDWFRIKGTPWDGRTLYDLYSEAYTPWEWHPRLMALANDLGMACFSTPFDATAVAFLEELRVPCHKIASFELVDIPLLRAVAATGKPVLLSTGMASLAEIGEAVETLRAGGTTDIALLKCTSTYPALPEDCNLQTIPHLGAAFNCPAGLSDHTAGSAIAVAAVALGARVVEKHMTLSRSDGGPDSFFSMEPEEFAAMVRDIRMVEKSLGRVAYTCTEAEQKSLMFRRSLFVVRDMLPGDIFTETTIRSIRPAHGLHSRFLNVVLGRTAAAAIPAGTPLTWDFLR